MRFLKLKIENITSLSGEHEVNFEELTKISSIFAITGETGSGKSSILNSISLALYGEVYKKNLSQLDLVSIGQREGKIDLVFEANGARYLAEWRAKVRKSNGDFYSTPPTPTRNIYRLEGEQKTHLQKSIEEITNLDFDQFTKCIILNQGEFSRFLLSNFSERKDILEKIYPTKRLEDIGHLLKKDIDLLENQNGLIQSELSSLTQTEKSKEEISQEIVLQEKLLREKALNIDEADGLNKTLIEAIENKLKINEVKSLLLQNKKNIQNLETKIFDERNSLTLEKSAYEQLGKEFEEKRPGLETQIKTIEELKRVKSTIIATDIEIKKDQEKRQQKQFDFDQTQEKLLELQVDDFNLEQEEQEIHRAEQRRLELSADFEKALEREKIEAERFHVSETISQITSSLELEKEGLKNLFVFQENEEEELRNEIERLKSQKIEYEFSHSKLEKLKSELQNLDSVIGVEAEREKLLKKREMELSLLEESYKFQQSISQCREMILAKHLKTCPVCDHEIIHLPSHLTFDVSAEDFERWQEEKKSQATELQHKNQQLTRLRADKSHLEREHQEHHEKVNKILITELNDKLSASSLSFQQKTEAKIQYSEKIKRISQLQEQLQFAQEKLRSLRERTEAIELKNNFKAAELRQQIDQLDELIKKKNNITRDLRLRASLNEKQSHFKSYIGELSLTIDKRVQETKALRELETQLSSQIQSEQKDPADQILFYKTEIKRLFDRLENQRLILQKSENMYIEIDSRMKLLESSLRDYELLQLLQLEKINQKASLEKNIDPEVSTDVLEALRLEIEKNLTSLKTEASLLERDLGRNQALLEEHQRKEVRISELLAQLQRNKNTLTQKKTLQEIIGKDELRSFVLSQVEENLIFYTNQELKNLCQNRYEILQLSKKLNRLTPEFFVLDKFKDSQVRKMSTLSGGEIFMVSLCMALALAEMTRGQAEINSLFIDEGFGTLDEDSLQDVIDMLHQVQGRGPVIGVISHIKSLTQALPAQLHLTKNAQGLSKLRIIS